MRRTPALELAPAVLATAATLAFLAVFASHSPALWRDEINSVNTQAAPTWGAMWRLSEFESFPVLWMLALRGWMTFGTSDAALRTFGLLGALSIPAAVWFAARTSPRPIVPVAGLALVAVNPAIIRWSASVRPWGVGAALAVVTFALVRDATVSPTRGRIVAATIVAIVSVHCLYQNAVLLAAMLFASAVVFAIRGEWRRLLVPIGIGLAAAVSLLPYGPVIVRRAEWNGLGESAVPVSHLLGQLADTASAAGPIVAIGWLAAAGLSIVLGASLGRSRSARAANSEGYSVGVYAAVTLATATLGLLTFYWWFRYPTQPWYYVGLLTLAAVCIDAVLTTALPLRTARTLRAGLALVVVAGGAVATWTELQEPMTNVDSVAARLRGDGSAEDLIVVNPWPLAITLTRYYPAGARVTTIPPIADHSVHRYDLLKQAMLEPNAIGPLLADIEATLRAGRRVFYVGRLDASPAGTHVTAPGRPPLPDTAWNSTRYEVAWSQQTGAFLRDHSAQMARVPIDARGGRLEDAQVAVFSGWKIAAEVRGEMR